MKPILRFFVLFAGLFIAGLATALGQVQLNSGGNVTVDACDAFPSAAYTIPNISLTELNSSDFQEATDKQFEIRLPAGFFFTGSPSGSSSPTTPTDLSNINVDIGTNSSVLEVSFEVIGTDSIDELVLSGLKVIAQTNSISGTVTFLTVNNFTELSSRSMFTMRAAGTAISISGGAASVGTNQFCDSELSSFSANLRVIGGENASSTIKHQWYQSSINNDVNFPTIISGATQNELNVTEDIQTSGTFYYLRETSYISGGNKVCTVRSSAVSVTIVSVDPGTIEASDNAICLGDNVTLTEVAGKEASSAEDLEYKWQKRIGLTGSFSDITTGTYTSSSLVLTSTTLTQTTTFRRLVKSVTCSTWLSSQGEQIVYVNRFPANDYTVDIEFSSGDTATQYVCSGGKMNPFLDNTSSLPPNDGVTYEWFKEELNGSAFDPPVSMGITTASIAPTITKTVKFFRKTFVSYNGAICEKTSNKLEVIVGARVNLGSIGFANNHLGSISPSQELVVSGGIPSPIASLSAASVVNGPSDINYQWFYYTDSNSNLRIPSGTSTSTTYTPTTAITETTYYVRAASNTATSTITNASETCGIVDRGRAVVARVPNVGVFSPISVCAETSFTLTPTSVSPSNIENYTTYQWQSSLDSNSGFVNVASGGNDPSYTSNTLTQSTYFRRIATITASDTLTITPTAVLVTVTSVNPGAISYSGGELCYGSDPSIITGTPVTGNNRRYQWYSKTDATAWTPISSNGQSKDYDPPANITETTYFKRETTLDFVGVGSCSANTASVTILVGSEIQGGSLANQTVNSGGDPGTLTVSSGSELSGLTYQWYSSTDGGTTPVTISTATATTYAPGALTQTTSYKRVTFKTENGKQCQAETNWATITVNTVTAGSISGSDTICSGASAPLSNSANPSATAGGTATYSWQAGTGPNSGAITWGAAIAGATGSSYTPTNITSSTYYRRGYTNTLNGVSSTVYTAPVLISVTPLPVINNTAIAAAISNVSCALGSDGAIAVLSSHISGGNTAQQQITEISVGGSPATGDQLSVVLDGSVYTHTVSAGQSTATIASALRDLINADAAAVVTASISSTSNVIQLKADVSGTPFSALASVGASSTASMITTTVQANAAPNTYSWTKTGDASFSASTLALSGLTAGSYTLAVTNGICTVNSASFTITQPAAALDLSLTTNCTETLTATPSGGNGPYVFVMTRPDGTTTTPISKSGAHEFTGLTIGATYSVQITDSSCSTSVTKTLTIPTPMALNASLITSTPPSCANSQDGSISIPNAAITGGLAPYQFELSSGVLTSTLTVNSANAANFTNLPAGLYNITVTDTAGCSATASKTITSLSPLNITFPSATDNNIQRLSCEGDQTGSFTIAISSDPSISPVIKWFKSSSDVPIATSGLTLSGLGEGDYRVEVSNGNAGECIVSRSFTVITPEKLTASFEAPISPKCYPNRTGSVKVNVTGGTGPYTYSIDGGVLSSFGTSGATALEYTIQNIPVGDHTIFISDANNCEVVRSPVISIETVSELILTHDENTQLTPIDCETPGNLSATVTGGTAPYFFKWSRSSDNYSFTENTNSSSTSTAKNIFNPGTYNVEVTDANGCTASLNVIMPDFNSNFSLTGTIISEQCVTEDSNTSRIELSTNAQAPYEVIWEKYGPSTSTTTSTTGSTTVTNTTTVFGWNRITQANGSLILNNLGFGDYRASVTETANTSGCDTVVKTFSIEKSDLRIFEQKLTAPSCENPEGSYSFKLNSSRALKFFLNGSQITPASTASSTFSLSNTTGKYTLSKLLEGAYTLRIVAQIPSGSSTTTTDGCELFTNFTLANYQPVVYGGETNVTLNLCDNSATFPDPSLVRGGVPFEDENGDPFYLYQWNGPNNLVTQGATPISVSEGTYELRIIDAQNCITAPITFNFSNNVAPVSVQETISPLGCGANNSSGAINISISGGRAPYQIVWEREIPATASSTLSYEEIGRNLLAVNNLAAGRYRLRITSSIVACENTEAITFTKFYTLSEVETLQVLGGPFLDRDLCIGAPGSLQLQVFDRNSEAFSFYYNGSLVSSSPLGNNNYEITVDQPVDEAILSVVNDAGCSVEIPIITGVGTPEFSFTSRSLEQTGLISANEDVTFTNTSIEPYTRMQWDFGDGTDPLEITAENAAVTDIEHRYKTPGTFEVSLRFYNALGCYKEVTQELRVGKGYLVIFPSAFTPNQDGTNDYFESKYTGITAFTLEIFDMWGNLLYSRSESELPVSSGWGWDGLYENGTPYTFKTFRYRFTALTHDGQEVSSSGEATLLR